MPTRRSLSAGAAVVAALLLVAGGVSLLPGAAPTASADALVPYAGCDELLEQYRDELARHASAYGGPMLYGGMAMDAVASTGGTAMAAAAPVPAAAGRVSNDAGASGTGTNVQERGVDEPDTAKLADGLLLTASGDRLHVVRAGTEPELLSTYSLGQSTWGAELLVQGDRVLVLVPDGGGGYGGPATDMRFPGGGGQQRTRAVLLDLADPTSPRLLEELRLDGRYLSARLSDGAVRLVTTSTPVVPVTYPKAPYGQAQVAEALTANVAAARAATLDQVLPRAVLRNGAGMVLSDERAVGCSGVRHASSAQGASTLLVTTLDLARGLAPVDTEAVTTDGDLVYAAADRLYVATSRWGTTAPPAVQDEKPATGTATVKDTVTTELHGFDTSSRTTTRYAGSASVPGYVLGRWALSSYAGHLRVATTSAPPWESGAATESGVSVLEERGDDLVETGRVEGLGKGEQIRAVRYFGDLATVVTFRRTDPLYVLDLGDPAAPKVIGELKVPGFSTYLHPVGDGLLLGIGQDADLQGRVTGVMAQVFDLRDLAHPVQTSKLLLGEGYTQVLDESRAFGWDAEHRTALLPFFRWDGTSAGSFAVGVGVGEDGALTERGRMEVAGQNGVDRVLHDADHVYAVSTAGVVAGSATTMERTGRAAFPSR